MTDLTWFTPLPKQRRFIASTARESVYAGGFGSGKTLAGGFKALVVALEHPGTVGLIARQTAGALASNTQKIILDGDDKPPIISSELIADRSEKHGTTITLFNGSQILFRSYQDWNEKKLLGPNYGFIYVDEATEGSERVWLALLSRLRHPAGPEQAWATTNPNGHDWLWHRFHPDSTASEHGAELIHAPTEENTNLSPAYVAWLRSQPLEWQKRFVDANFDTASGAIWSEWDRSVHVAQAFRVPEHWKSYESLDHGRRNPTAVLWYAVDEDGNLLVENGYYSPGLVSQHATAILTIRGDRKMPPITADPSVFVKGHDNQSPADEYRKHGLQLTEANNVVSAGLNRVSELLMRQEGVLFPDWHQFGGTLGPDGKGSPRLFVLDVPGTLDLRREISDYRWKDLSPTMESRQDQPEEPRKKDDHACDSLRYGAMARPLGGGLLDWYQKQRDQAASAPPKRTAADR